jgi:hypothetical protein
LVSSVRYRLYSGVDGKSDGTVLFWSDCGGVGADGTLNAYLRLPLSNLELKNIVSSVTVSS